MAHSRSIAGPLGRWSCCGSASWQLPTQRIAGLQPSWLRYASTQGTDPKKKKKKARSTFKAPDIKGADQFALVDAMRYIRAFEVGQNPASRKYELHVRIRTLKNGPVIRNRIRLPHPVKTDLRICVLAPPDSKAAADAKKAGASIVGEEDLFPQIREGTIAFDRLICHIDSFPKLTKAGFGRVLGPKGLMPSTKLGTVVSDVGKTLTDMVGASEYRERVGVVRLAIGQLGFTPEELRTNVRAFMDSLKKDIAQMAETISKEVHEVVLSSTGSPGFTLSAEYRGADSIDPEELSGPN